MEFPRGPARLVDAVLALTVAGAVALAVLLAEEPASRPAAVGGYLLSVALGGLLLARRRHPVGVLLATAVVVLAYHAAGWPAIGYVWPLSVPLYSAAVTGYAWLSLAVGTVLLGQGAVWRMVADDAPLLRVADGLIRDGAWLGLVVALGVAVHNRRGWAAAIREQARSAERLRIARELHDLVAHTLTVVGIKLHVAAETLTDTPDRAGQAIEDAQRVRGQAMTELRSLIRVLRAAPEPAARLPSPGLADLDAVVTEVSRAGLTVTRDESGDPSRVPPAVALTTYHIVRESLTNVLRHAGAGRARLRLRYGPDAVVVEVADDGAGQPRVTDGTGHGLTGLRERTLALGGRFTAGTRPGGGYRIRAVLPLDGGGP